MSKLLITVNGKPFVGRMDEQKGFRTALLGMLNPPHGETQPYICLIYSDGGMGKTTLARRFRDIAETEQPLEGEFQILWVDWEDESQLSSALQVGRENITPETVFDVIHTVSIRQDWGRYFTAYQDMLKKREKAEMEAVKALESSGERDELAAFRGASVSALAKLVRTNLPAIGKTGETLVQTFLDAGIKVSAEQAAHLRTMLETRLRARLKPDQFNTFLYPHEQLALSLAKDLKKIASQRPLILFLDTYEIVDHCDHWLRKVIQVAGPKILWVICGRNDLEHSHSTGTTYDFKGYAEEFQYRLITFDIYQLTLEDLHNYFAARVPQRVLDDGAAEVICRATRGIPLAIEVAADLWAKGIALEDIGGDTRDTTPHKEIVAKMTAQYLRHGVAEGDRVAIYALTLARGDIEVLRAMLRPADEKDFNLEVVLQRMARDYASVHAAEARLHDEPAVFFRKHLQNEIRRTSDEIQTLNRRAETVLRARLTKWEEQISLIEERCVDEDWIKAALSLTDHLFWLDETKAWQWLILRYVEGLVYNRDLVFGLLEIASGWKDTLSRHGQNRLEALKTSGTASELSTMLDELEYLARLGWLDRDGGEERRAIINLLRGYLSFNDENYQETLVQFERAEKDLPTNGKKLKTMLGEALYNLAGSFLWPQGQTNAVCSTEAEHILHKVVAWLPEKPRGWYRLGTTLSLTGKLTEAIQAYNQAIALDPKYATPHYGLGHVYSDQGRYEEAIQACQQAIALDPKFAYPYNGLGNVYRNQDRYEEAIQAYKQAIKFDPKDCAAMIGIAGASKQLGDDKQASKYIERARTLSPDRYNLACLESISGNIEAAVEHLRLALEENPSQREWARRDPDFDFIRHDP
ncbi:MAG: tetratricopeptide repeat protein, partial [Anaerolineales bacterium]|nr:tetratricopeptide repeat protein [Anaerolineales bacterium]